MEKAVTEGFWYTTDTGDFRNDPIYVSAACFWDHSEIMPCSTLDSSWASLVVHWVKNSPTMQKTPVQSLDWEDPPGEGNGNPLQYSCLENPMDRGVWQAIVRGVTRVAHDLVTKWPPSLDL